MTIVICSSIVLASNLSDIILLLLTFIMDQPLIFLDFISAFMLDDA